MNPIDIIILYFTCGAPVAVYFYLQNTAPHKSKYVFLKTILVFILWIPFAIYTFNHSKITKKLLYSDSNKNDFDDSQTDKRCSAIQKQIEKIFVESNLTSSFFDFRQTIERYAGLSLSIQNVFSQHGEDDEVCESEKEIFRVSNEKNIELAAICLTRRNRKLLEFHHRKARRDFLQEIGNLSASVSDQTKLKIFSLEFVNSLNDFEARESLEKLFVGALQTDNLKSVTQLENVLWKPAEPPKPLPTKTPTISARLTAVSAITNLHSKD